MNKDQIELLKKQKLDEI